MNGRPAVSGLLLAVAGCVHPPPEDSAASTSNERRLAVADGWLQGTSVGRGQGPPVVFLHDIGGNHHVFDAQVDHLKGRRRVVAYDQRGCGGSSLAPRKLYDIETLAGDLKAVLDAISADRAVLVGHSLGANVITRFAEKYPERAVALVLIDAPGDVRKPVSALAEELKPLDEAGFRVRLDQFFGPLLQGAAARTREQVLASLQATKREVLEGMLVSLGAWDPAPVLANFSGPMVAIVGQDSPKALHDVDPRIRSVVIPEASHWPMLDQPARVNAVLDELLATVP